MTFDGYYLNEKIEIVEENENSYLIRYTHDGFEEEVPKDEVVVFQSSGLKRSRINPYNKERRKKKFKRNFGSEERVKLIKKMTCVVPSCSKRNCHNAHVKARGMGGAKGDKNDIVPLCPKHHREQEKLGNKDFEKEYDINLLDEAARITTLLGDK